MFRLGGSGDMYGCMYGACCGRIVQVAGAKSRSAVRISLEQAVDV